MLEWQFILVKSGGNYYNRAQIKGKEAVWITKAQGHFNHVGTSHTK